MNGALRSRLVLVMSAAVLSLAVTASAADRKVLMEYFNATW